MFANMITMRNAKINKDNFSIVVTRNDNLKDA